MLRRGIIVLFTICTTGWSADPGPQAGVYSKLWGRTGELWDPKGRLPDFSYAGYRSGEAAIPDVPARLNVRDFGALGDGEHDDSQAFVDAIAAAGEGAISVPQGRYRITRILEIEKPGVVLRGEGPHRTALFFPVPLNEIRPNWGETTSGRRTSNYSWSGGFLWLRGDYRAQRLADVVSEAHRGDCTLRVSTTERLKPGDYAELHMQDTEENSLARHLYADDPGSTRKLNGQVRHSLVFRVADTHGQVLRLDRPLRADVCLQWGPQIRAFRPTVSETGIEALSIEFPATPYKGHFTEVGYNAVAMSGVANCWLRDVRIVNADSGIFLGSRFCTLSRVVLESVRRPSWSSATGHHGITLGGTDNLLTGFEINTRFIHDLTVTLGSMGNVCANGKGTDLSVDHHKRAPYQNLFTNLDAGEGHRLWKCGGGRSLGRHCAARTTFWNIRAASPQRHPGRWFGPELINLVAVETRAQSRTAPDGRWFEAIPPTLIRPADLYAAQLMRRLGK